MFAKILKANPYHDKSGKFTSKDKAGSVATLDLIDFKTALGLGTNPIEGVLGTQLGKKFLDSSFLGMQVVQSSSIPKASFKEVLKNLSDNGWVRQANATKVVFTKAGSKERIEFGALGVDPIQVSVLRSATDKDSNLPIRPLSLAERQRAVAEYIATGYDEVNTKLRAGDAEYARTNKWVRGIDASMEPSKTSMKVYRGVTKAMFGESGPKVGDIVSDNGFFSTSTSKSVASNFAKRQGKGSFIAEVEVPAGTKLMNGNKEEKEVLLDRNLQFQVVSVSGNSVKLTVIGSTKKMELCMYSKILKANPYHDENGLFSTRDKAKSRTSRLPIKVVDLSQAMRGGESDTSKLISRYGGLYVTTDAETASAYGDVSNVNMGKLKVLDIYETPEVTEKFVEQVYGKVEDVSDDAASAFITAGAKVVSAMKKLGVQAIKAHEMYFIAGEYVPKKTKKLEYATILKANPYHDEQGRFSSRDRANFMSVGGKFAGSARKAKEREERIKKISADYENLNTRFVKDGYKGRYSNPATIRRLSEYWADTVPNGVMPSELVDAWVGKGTKLPGANIEADPLYKQLKFTAHNVDVHGAKAKLVERTLDFKKGDAHHDYLKLEETSQGGSAVKKMFAEVVPLYKKMGMKKITTYANLEAGGYAWGRYGFVNDDAGEVAEPVAAKLRRISRDIGYGSLTLSKEAVKELDDAHAYIMAAKGIKYESHHVTALQTPILDRELHDVMRREMKMLPSSVTPTVAKWGLYNRSWNATLRFDDEVAMTQLNKYVGKTL